MIEEKGLEIEDFPDAFGCSRATMFNWFKRETAPPKGAAQKLATFFGVSLTFVQHGIRAVQLKQTHERPGWTVHAGGPHAPENAQRSPSQPGAPSTRTDCEAYIISLLDAAGHSGNPNAFPVIFDRLKKKFPLTEWEEDESDPDRIREEVIRDVLAREAADEAKARRQRQRHSERPKAQGGAGS